MKYNETTLNKAIRAGERHGLWLLYGAEPLLVERWARQLMGEGAGEDPFNAQRLDGKKPDLEALWDAVQSLPLFAQEKTVLLDGLEGASLSGEDLKTFEALLEELPDSTTLVITAKDPGFGGSAAGKKLIKLVEKHGAAVELGARSQGDLVKFLQQEAQERGCTLDGELARYILQLCPTEMHTLLNEIDKICAFAGGGTLTRAQVDAVAVPKIEARAFDLQKHILAGDTGAALRLLADLFYLREEPIAILGALSMSFCDLYRARCVRDAGGNQGSLAADFGYKSEYRARRAWDQSGRQTTPRLRRAVMLLCDCDRLMKSTGVDTKLRLEQLTVRMARLCRERR